MPRTLIHDVYFTLHDPSPANIDRLVAACYELLAGHPGERFFAAGTVAHYQVSPRHQRFVAETPQNPGAASRTGRARCRPTDDPRPDGVAVGRPLLACC